MNETQKRDQLLAACVLRGFCWAIIPFGIVTQILLFTSKLPTRHNVLLSLVMTGAAMCSASAIGLAIIVLKFLKEKGL